jgi:hypothetical protein
MEIMPEHLSKKVLNLHLPDQNTARHKYDCKCITIIQLKIFHSILPKLKQKSDGLSELCTGHAQSFTIYTANINKPITL